MTSKFWMKVVHLANIAMVTLLFFTTCGAMFLWPLFTLTEASMISVLAGILAIIDRVALNGVFKALDREYIEETDIEDEAQ